MIAGSAHPRQATDWLADIDQTTSMQDLDAVGSVFGSTWMIFETRDSRIAKGPMEIMNPAFNRKDHVAEDLQEKEKLTMLTER